MSAGSENGHPGLPQVSTTQAAELIASLDLPEPLMITPFSENTGTYHSIFFLAFPASTDFQSQISVSENGTKDLILRVSVADFPRIKNENEVAVMNWIRQNTTIPLPLVVANSPSRDNPLGYEYILMERCGGTVLSSIAHELSSEEERAIVDQLIDYLSQLHSRPWNHIGGLRQEHDDFIPGPMVGEQFWHAWDSNFDDPLAFNPHGPYKDLSSCFTDQIFKHQKAIEYHDKLAPVQDLPIPQLLYALQDSKFKAEVNGSVRFVLAHRDLHYRNLLYCRETRKITSVIDWELAAVVPYPLWNPGGFLWNGGHDESADKEQARMMKLYEQVVREKEMQFLLDDGQWQNDAQATVQRATLMLRRLINGRLRGWEKEKGAKHRRKFEEAVSKVVKSANAISNEQQQDA